MSLSTLNLSAAILHYTLAVGFGLYFNYLNNKYPNNPVSGIETSVRQHELSLYGQDVSGGKINSQWVSTQQYIYDLTNIQTLLVSFFIITGTFHLFYYVSGGKRGDGIKDNISNLYTRVIDNKNNYFRWIEYSITSTMMLYIIAYSAEVKDVEVYNMLFATNVSMIATGQMVETAVRDGGDWVTPMITGFLLLVAEFVPIFRAITKRFNEINNFLDTHPILSSGIYIPTWLAYLGIVLFILYASFGFISLYGAYANVSYETIENLYIIFSFVAKATLGFIMAFGLSQRQVTQNS